MWSAGDFVDEKQFQKQVHAGVEDDFVKKTNHHAFLKTYDSEHPADGAKILSQFKDFPPAILDAVAEHHVKLDGKGFPFRQDPYKPNRIAELIGICGDLAQSLKTNGPDRSQEVIAKIRGEAPKNFSPAIIEAFDKTFNPAPISLT